MSLTVKLSETEIRFFGDRRCFHGRNGAMARKEGCAAEVVVAAPLVKGGGRQKGEKKREEKRKKRRKKKEDRRRRMEGEGEEEGSLVHGEIARPLTILRYYARPFLQRSLCSLARTNRRPSWNMVYRKRERSGGRRRRTGSCPFCPVPDESIRSTRINRPTPGKT